MPAANDLTFQSGANKDYLRSLYDRPIIEAWMAERGRPLKYLGLPGSEMLDIIEWQDFLSSFSTIERSENAQHLMFLTANVRDVEHRLHSLYGEFDDILIKGKDQYSHMPRWPYDLVNLDFFGGLLYSNLTRPRALRKLIENQEIYKTSFLLIITYHIRDRDLTDEKESFLGDLEKKLLRDFPGRRAIPEVIAWYRKDDTPDVARQTLYLNVFLHEQGEAAQFQVTCRPAILYSGTRGARMLHFVTEFRYQKGAHRAVSNQSLIDVVNFGYRELIGRELVGRDVPKIKSTPRR
jgi:hypothetical protein